MYIFYVVSIFLVFLTVDGGWPLGRSPNLIYQFTNLLGNLTDTPRCHNATSRSQCLSRWWSESFIIRSARSLVHDSCVRNHHQDFWGCQLGSTRLLFGRVLRETAYLAALSGAALANTVALGCSTGILDNCHCGLVTNTGRYQHSSVLCPPNVQYGGRLTTRFFNLDENDVICREKRIALKHNIRVGLKVYMKLIKKLCACTSTLGTCQSKVCWNQPASFQEVADHIAVMYEKAERHRGFGNSLRLPKYPQSKLIYIHKTLGAKRKKITKVRCS